MTPLCGNYTTKNPVKRRFPRLFVRGPGFAMSSSAFNRILDFSNGLDFYLGFFLFLPAKQIFFAPAFPTASNAGHFRYFCLT
jgi:hypothetical protein